MKCRVLVITVILTALYLLPVKPYAAEQLPDPGPNDRCAVCGMFVAKYQNWVSVVVLRDGTKAYFDGPKDMFRYLQSPEKYGSRAKKEDIATVLVKDYYTTEPVLARDAFFVIGSDVLGPMGRELIPLKGRKEAETFMKDHQGKKILTFDQVTPPVLADLE